MLPNETTSTFQVTSEQFPLLFDYVSHVSYDTQEKMLSLTLPLFTIDENNNISMVADSKHDKHGTFALLHHLQTENKPITLSLIIYGTSQIEPRFVLLQNTYFLFKSARYDLSEHNGTNIMSVTLTLTLEQLSAVIKLNRGLDSAIERGIPQLFAHVLLLFLGKLMGELK